MQYRVWIEEIGEWMGVEPIEATSPEAAAIQFANDPEGVNDIFPEENDGDVCTVNVCEWEELDEEDDEPEHETFAFRLIIDRRVERQR